jgi:hypothetical protein
MVSFFLDAGGAGLIWIAYTLFFFFIVLAILLEAGIMLLMKYTSGIKKALTDSLLVNLASLAIGFVLLEAFDNFFGYYTIFSVVVLYAITVLIEFFLLRLLNRQHSNRQTWLVVMVMNLVTYTLLYMIGNG